MCNKEKKYDYLSKANKQAKKTRIVNYELNSTKCKFCKISLSYGKRKNKFCSRKCSASFNNIGISRNSTNGSYSKKECLSCKKLTYNLKCCSRLCSINLKNKNRVDKIYKTGIIDGTPNTIKKCLFKLKEHKCEICNQVEWMGRPIPLVLDHINGKPSDNRIVNLRFVCGNCNMQLDTFAGKNVGKGGGRPYRNMRYKEGKSW